MRLTVGTLALPALLLAGATFAEEPLFPGARTAPPPSVEPTPRPPAIWVPPLPPAAANRVPKRAPLRDTSGDVRGFQDRGVGDGRGVVRDTDGTVRGFLTPNRSGGATIRGTDGSVQGYAPSSADIGRYRGSGRR